VHRDILPQPTVISFSLISSSSRGRWKGSYGSAWITAMIPHILEVGQVGWVEIVLQDAYQFSNHEKNTATR
jgi:hypothetical protein